VLIKYETGVSPNSVALIMSPICFMEVAETDFWRWDDLLRDWALLEFLVVVIR
jgi:hypothetical protein